MEDLKELDKMYIANTYSRFPVEIKYGEGSIISDEDGKQYIDMGGGIAVNIFGMQDKAWKNAVISQLNKFQHTSNLYYTEPCVTLAKLLIEKTGMKKVFFSNSGAEANECAIKAIRKYAQDKKGPDYYTIITLKNSFHGRTLATLAATGQEDYHKDFLPLTEGFISVTPGDINELENTVKNNKCAGILIETIQGEGGVVPLDPNYIQQVYSLAQEKDLVFAIDEVQTGNGRTGKLYSYMHYSIKPDIITTAKGLGGGLPIGATVLGEKVEFVLSAGKHGSTFGGNPVCAAGAVSIISRINDKLLSDVMQKSEIVFETLSQAPGIKSVTGKGLMIGIETEKEVDKVVNECIEKGVLVLKAKNKVRLVPPLNIGVSELKKALSIILEVCAAI